MKLPHILIAIVLISATGLAADLNDGLIAHFPFSGSADDASGNNNPGTVYGASLTTDRLGNPDAAYLFDGINDYILVEDSIPLRLANMDFSISVWAIETQRNVGYQDALLVKRGPLTEDGWFFSITGQQSLSSQGVGKLYYQVSGGDDPRAYSPGSIPLDTWTHLLVTYNNTDHIAALFVNGTQVTSSSIPSPNPNTEYDLCIGSDSQGNGYHFHGKIDDVRIYNRQLSQSEIQELAGILGDMIAPEALSVTRAEGLIQLNWNPVPTATSYQVFSSTDPSLPHEEWILAASGLQTTQWSTPVSDRMFFFVRAYR